VHLWYFLLDVVSVSIFASDFDCTLEVSPFIFWGKCVTVTLNYGSLNHASGQQIKPAPPLVLLRYTSIDWIIASVLPVKVYCYSTYLQTTVRMFGEKCEIELTDF
jgi:hypothetical protein